QITHFRAFAQVRTVWRLAHALLTTRNDDRRRAELDLLGPERHGPEPRAAELVHAPGRAVDRNAGGDRCLASWILASARGEDLAHDDLVDLSRLDAGPLDCRFDCNFAELVCRKTRKRAIE